MRVIAPSGKIMRASRIVRMPPMPSPKQNPGLRAHARRRALRCLALLAGWCVAIGPLPASADQPAQTEGFKDAEFPAPPRQNAPWTPPKTSVPAPVVQAFTELFKQGLPDPRDCEYREIAVIAQGDIWGFDETEEFNTTMLGKKSPAVKTHGWIIPGKEGATFAICWNGLIYPVVSTGGKADLADDIRAMLAADVQSLEKYKAQQEKTEKEDRERQEKMGRPYSPSITFGPGHAFAADEKNSVSQLSMLPMKEAMLLRLGEGELADKFWTQWISAAGENAMLDPVASFRGIWLTSLFRRVIDAHTRGDDHLAAAGARNLIAVRKAMGIPPPPKDAGNRSAGDVDGNDLATLVLEDSQRRIAEGPYTPVLQQSPKMPDGPERIHLLIRDLELVHGMQHDSHGGVSMDEDASVQALIAEGQPAIEPLLKCIEEDHRLTRSVWNSPFGGMGNDMGRDCAIIGVQEPAYVALATILKTNFFEVRWSGDSLTMHGEAGRKEMVAEIRAYLKKYGAASEQERWYRILADDQAPAAQWVEAMENITRPADVTVTASASYATGWIRTPFHKPGDPPVPPAGESLRKAGLSPSVTELLLKRLHAAESGQAQIYERITRALAAWDGANQLDELRHAQEVAERNTSDLSFINWLFDKRNALGDKGALDEYAKRLAYASGWGSDEQSTLKFFELAWMHPEPQAIQDAITHMYEPDNVLSLIWSPATDYRKCLIYSPLVGFPGFRAALLRGLRDKSPATSITLKDGKFDLDGRTGDLTPVNKLDPLLPKDATPLACRVCDIYAYYLRQIPGAPDCELYWPEAKRDEAVAACADYLNTYGDHLRYRPGQEDILDMLKSRAVMTFDPLDHPATEEDVAQHRAIFALKGERRVWKMPATPIDAVWKSPDAPLESRGQGDRGWPYPLEFYISGKVWQAEEQLVDGKWVRYFGFVGQHRVMRVPASEIELNLFSLPRTRDYWARMPGGFDSEFQDPDGAWTPGYVSSAAGIDIAALPLGKPVMALLALRNSKAEAVTLPADLFQDEANPKLLPPGIKLAVSCSEITPANPDPKEGWDMDKLQWKELPIREGSYAKPAQDHNPVSLDTAEAKTLFKINLGDFFDMSRHGIYRVTVSYLSPSPLANQSETATFVVGDSPWPRMPAEF